MFGCLHLASVIRPLKIRMKIPEYNTGLKQLSRRPEIWIVIPTQYGSVAHYEDNDPNR
jgi:hypothetical protein